MLVSRKQNQGTTKLIRQQLPSFANAAKTAASSKVGDYDPIEILLHIPRCEIVVMT